MCAYESVFIFIWRGQLGFPQIRHTISKLQSVVCSDGRFRCMREALHRCDPPCIPYLGMYLTDLSFIEEGTPDFTHDGLLNFSKMRMVSGISIVWASAHQSKLKSFYILFSAACTRYSRGTTFPTSTIQNRAHPENNNILAGRKIITWRWWTLFTVLTNWTANISFECTEHIACMKYFAEG